MDYYYWWGCWLKKSGLEAMERRCVGDVFHAASSGCSDVEYDVNIMLIAYRTIITALKLFSDP